MEFVRLMKHVGNFYVRNHFIHKKDGFGLNELLGIAAAIIIAAFIIIPGMRTFASSLMTGLGNWWNNVIANRIFPNT